MLFTQSQDSILHQISYNDNVQHKIFSYSKEKITTNPPKNTHPPNNPAKKQFYDTNRNFRTGHDSHQRTHPLLRICSAIKIKVRCRVEGSCMFVGHQASTTKVAYRSRKSGQLCEMPMFVLYMVSYKIHVCFGRWCVVWFILFLKW